MGVTMGNELGNIFRNLRMFIKGHGCCYQGNSITRIFSMLLSRKPGGSFGNCISGKEEEKEDEQKQFFPFPEGNKHPTFVLYRKQLLVLNPVPYHLLGSLTNLLTARREALGQWCMRCVGGVLPWQVPQALGSVGQERIIPHDFPSRSLLSLQKLGFCSLVLRQSQVPTLSSGFCCCFVSSFHKGILIRELHDLLDCHVLRESRADGSSRWAKLHFCIVVYSSFYMDCLISFSQQA